VQETVSGSTALAVTYTYDVFGQRIEEDKWTSGTGTVATRFVWSGAQVMLDMNGSNVVQERYLWGDTQDQLLARIDGNGTAWWYLTDREGSVRDVLNASGAQADHTDYTAFGVIITQTSAAAQGRFAFTSKDDDSQTGFQYSISRYYAPALGIFITTDPILFDGGLTTLYGYCGNDPTNATDPSGERSEMLDYYVWPDERLGLGGKVLYFGFSNVAGFTAEQKKYICALHEDAWKVLNRAARQIVRLRNERKTFMIRRSDGSQKAADEWLAQLPQADKVIAEGIQLYWGKLDPAGFSDVAESFESAHHFMEEQRVWYENKELPEGTDARAWPRPITGGTVQLAPRFYPGHLVSLR
jgi:RHS repeat-associated protein